MLIELILVQVKVKMTIRIVTYRTMRVQDQPLISLPVLNITLKRISN